jgi:hypothetical protein
VIAMNAGFTTFIREIGDGQFEFGWRRAAKNFRKQNDEYVRAGIAATVAEAEAARGRLALKPPAKD